MSSNVAIAQNPSFMLPNVRGRYAFAFDLSKVTWFKVGGVAEVLFKPKDAQDLITFIKEKDPIDRKSVV